MAHSWGDNVFRNFLHWMEQEDRGWADKHIHAYANIGGPVLGVPKSISALLSGMPPVLLLAAVHCRSGCTRTIQMFLRRQTRLQTVDRVLRNSCNATICLD